MTRERFAAESGMRGVIEARTVKSELLRLTRNLSRVSKTNNAHRDK